MISSFKSLYDRVESELVDDAPAFQSNSFVTLKMRGMYTIRIFLYYLIALEKRVCIYVAYL